jgi:type VI protein secretion system component VasK
VVRNDVLVPAAFTAEGWDFVHRRLDDPDALFGFEDWVVGGDPPPPEERRALAAELRARYEAEYVRRWAEFISASSFRRSGAVATTARQLQMLGGRESPVLQVLAVVSENTDVDSTVAAVFEPVHLVVPPGEAALVGEGNQAYVDALASIAMALAPLAEPGGSGGAAGGAVTQSATQAEDAVRQVALAFPVDGDAGAIADAVEQLLRQPIVSARSLARGLPSQQANAAGSSFCADFRALSASYPFATGGPDASLEDFVAMFQPDESTLWAYYDRTLQNFLEPRGSRFEAIPNSSPTATAELVRFFNDAAMITSTFWESGNESGPELVFGLQLRTNDRLTEVEVQVDNQVHTFTQTAPRMASVIWVGEGAREARITGVLDGQRVPLVAPQDGQWALFELFRTASWVPRGARTFDVVWQLPGSMPPLEGTVSMNTDVPVLSRDFLAGLRCVSTIVR